MSKTKASVLHRQITRVSRRLFIQTLFAALFWSWAGTLLVAAAWFLLQPYWLASLAEWGRLGIPCAVLAVGSVVAVIIAVIRTPSRVAAALLLDERFGLKERVTTSLLLAPDQRASAAGQALLEDVALRVDGLDIGSRIPLRVSWVTMMMPVVASLVAVLAFYYPLPENQASADTGKDEAKQPPVNAADVAKKMKQLVKKEKSNDRNATDRPKSEDLKRIEAELDRIANRPHDTKDQLKERIKEMTSLEEQMKKQEKEWAERSRALKQQLKELEKAAGKEGQREGPAKDLQKALAEGNLEKARQELERLGKKVQSNQLSATEKRQLAKQLKDVAKQLERHAKQKDKEEQLKQLAREGKLDKEALKREMKRLQQDSEKMKDLQKLAQDMAQSSKRLEEGDGEGAAEAMKNASDQMKDMNMDDAELQDLRADLQRLQDAKDSC